MQLKKLIFNSDDFGYSYSFNEGIRQGVLNGLLTSTCILANGEAFESAVKEFLPQLKGIGLGVHLNIIEGKSIINEQPFNKGFIEILAKSNESAFLNKIEAEFRAQIERVLEYSDVDHLNSHVHVHSIPKIFELTCKLARDYKIDFVRTQFEKPYFVPSFKKHLNLKYPVNLVKVALLNSFTEINRQKIEEYGLKTNDYLIGVGYTSFMDENTIKYGLKTLKSGVAEILIHPSTDEISKLSNFKELQACQNLVLREEIQNQGWELVSYKDF